MTISRKSAEMFVLGVVAFILSGALQVIFASGSDLATEGDSRYEVILVFLYMAILIIGTIHFRRTTYGALHTPALMCLLVLSVLSAGWAQFPGEVLRRNVGLLGASLFGIVLGSRLSTEEQLKVFRWVFRIAAISSLILVLVYPDFGIMKEINPGAWRGIYNHKNILGGVMALAVLIEWLVPSRSMVSKIEKIASLSLYGLLLVFSDSITSLIAILLTLGVLYAFRIVRRQYGMPLPLLIVIGLTVGGFITANRETVTGLFGRSSDITGRTELWSWVVKMILSRPWLGFGFSGFWKGGSSESTFLEKAIGWSPMYSHNGYLEILLSLGLAGLVLFLWFVLGGLRRAVRQAETAESPVDLWPLAFLVYFLFHNFGECTILWQNSLEWAMCISVVVGADPRLRAPYESALEEPEAELTPATEYANV